MSISSPVFIATLLSWRNWFLIAIKKRLPLVSRFRFDASFSFLLFRFIVDSLLSTSPPPFRDSDCTFFATLHLFARVAFCQSQQKAADSCEILLGNIEIRAEEKKTLVKGLFADNSLTRNSRILNSDSLYFSMQICLCARMWIKCLCIKFNLHFNYIGCSTRNFVQTK